MLNRTWPKIQGGFFTNSFWPAGRNSNARAAVSAVALFSLFTLFSSVFISGRQQARGVGAAGTDHTNYYVSRRGNNADGKTWATAWSELSNIDWSIIRPGDTIYIDGGSTSCASPNNTYNPSARQYGLRPGFDCGMRYESTLTLGKSGTATSPINIKLSQEPGRNGTAVIFGGRIKPLGYCGQTDYVYQTAGVRSVGITGRQSYVVLDGAKWGGIIVYGHNLYGIDLSSTSNLIFRNMEIYDNGKWIRSRNYPDQPGVKNLGADNIFDRVIVHDNGQDSFQTGSATSNFTLRNSWLYNARKDPDSGQIEDIWNYCRHSDGIQIYGGHVQSGVTIENSIIGPGFMQGVLLGDSSQYPNGPWATVNDVTITNTLFYGNHNASIHSHNPVNGGAKNWRIENVTSDRKTGEKWSNISYNATAKSIAINNSILYGGNSIYIPNGGRYGENCQYDVSGASVGTNVNPGYANSVHGSSSLTADFALSANSACRGKGSSITSVGQLLGASSNPTIAPGESTPTPAIIIPTATPARVLTPSARAQTICSGDTNRECSYTTDCKKYADGTLCEKNTGCNNGKSSNNVYVCLNGIWVYKRWERNGTCNYCDKPFCLDASDPGCDGNINFPDLLRWRLLWAGSDRKANVNGDGKTNLLDYLAVLRNWLSL